MPPRKLKKWSDDDASLQTQAAYHSLVRGLARLPMSPEGGRLAPVRLKLSPTAKRGWIDWFNSWAEEQYGATGDLRAAYSKLEAVALRIALLHHAASEVCEGRDATRRILRGSMDAGVELARWFAGEARRVYARLRASESTREAWDLAGWLGRRGGKVTSNELHKSNKGAYPDAQAARLALDSLVNAGLARWERSGGPGRPTDQCVLAAPPAPPENPETPKPRSLSATGEV